MRFRRESAAYNQYAETIKDQELHADPEFNKALQAVYRRIASLEDAIVDGDTLSVYELFYEHMLLGVVDDLKELIGDENVEDYIPGLNEQLESLKERAAIAAVNAYAARARKWVGRPHRQEEFFTYLEMFHEELIRCREALPADERDRVDKEYRNLLGIYEAQQAEAVSLREEYRSMSDDERESQGQEILEEFQAAIGALSARIEERKNATVDYIQGTAERILHEISSLKAAEQVVQAAGQFQKEVASIGKQFADAITTDMDSSVDVAFALFDPVHDEAIRQKLQPLIEDTVNPIHQLLSQASQDVQQAFINFGRNIEVQAVTHAITEHQSKTLDTAYQVLGRTRTSLEDINRRVQAGEMSRSTAERHVRSQLAQLKVERERAKSKMDAFVFPSAFSGKKPIQISFNPIEMSMAAYGFETVDATPQFASVDAAKAECVSAIHAAYTALEIELERWLAGNQDIEYS